MDQRPTDHTDTAPRAGEPRGRGAHRRHGGRDERGVHAIALDLDWKLSSRSRGKHRSDTGAPAATNDAGR